MNKQLENRISSREVAEMMEVGHSELLRKIKGINEDLTESKIAFSKYWTETTYKDASGKSNREFQITKRGCEFLAHKTTGTKGNLFTDKYMDRFNEMEQFIKEGNPYAGLSKELQSIFILDKKTQEIEGKIEKLENNMPLFNIDCKELQTLVKRKGVGVLGGKGSRAYKDNSIRGKVYSDIQQQLRREFQVTRYEAIKRSQLEIAKGIVEGYKAPLVLIDEILRVNNQVEFEVMSEVACTR